MIQLETPETSRLKFHQISDIRRDALVSKGSRPTVIDLLIIVELHSMTDKRDSFQNTYYII